MRHSEALLWDTLVFIFSNSGFKWKINLMLTLQSTGMTSKIRTRTKKKQNQTRQHPPLVVPSPNRAKLQ